MNAMKKRTVTNRMISKEVMGDPKKSLIKRWDYAYFNQKEAYEEYKNPKDRRDDSTREETAHKVAWSAVEKKYEKRAGKWRSKSD